MPARQDSAAPAESDALARSPLLGRLDAGDRRALLDRTERLAFPARTRVHGDADAGKHLYLILVGEASLRREHLAVRRLQPGDHFGELAATGLRHRGELVTAETPLTAARLDGAAWTALTREAPALAVKLAVGLAALVQEELDQATADMGLLLRGRSLPRAPEVLVRVLGERTGTRIADLLPVELDGDLVVAGMLGQKPVSLSTPILTETSISPLLLSHWEGRPIYAQSLGLLLLEAAQQVAPAARVHMGPSRGTRQLVELQGEAGDRTALAAAILAGMERIAAADASIRQEFWPTDEALRMFTDRGWDDAARLLRTRRQATVRLASCGDVYALSMGPLLPTTGLLKGFRVVAGEDGLWLELGDRDPRLALRAPRATPAVAPGGPVLETAPRDVDMLREHQRWLAAMGVTSVGAFADSCITGQVSQLIRVAEGFHEKRIGLIADQVAARR